ncbi:beta-glucosidase [Cryomorphaceae bacterium S-15]|uniref:Beta-glucosidase n=2 Tax=Acidiluteibacter ferrifornacis TaxID=2692424 RepID=A0A6N9NIP5_9FLAO|nr:beta-glucosidase [bacterium]NBG66556.1 beta-glucosidase [Acidiluteibacter ferrifornacis]
MIMEEFQFRDDFHWGVSTSAFQIEGAHDQYGKGPSIWDKFTENKKNISNRDNAKIACDFYHKYEEDLQTIKALGIPNFRFSISWSRIYPEGYGHINQKGVDFYNRLIDRCLELEIEPWVTLYHWDLPHNIELRGGWTNRRIVDWFFEYTAFCVAHFGDRVKRWMVLNEPMVFTGAGYFLGIHAPGKRGLKNFVPAVHHAVLAQAVSGNIIKDLRPDSIVGTTFSCSLIEPFRPDNEKDIRAAKRVDALTNRLFIEPSLGMGYPLKELPFLKRIEKYMRHDDEARMKFDFDFVGIQNYTREIIKFSRFTPYIGAKLVESKKRNVPTTEMGWEVYPKSLYAMAKKFSAYDGVKQVIVTENGAAFDDEIQNDKIYDSNRISYIAQNLKQLKRAHLENLKVSGYFVWSLLDNFEWSEGYRPRFGIVHVDYKTLNRTIKSSALWYQQVIQYNQTQMKQSCL